MNYEISNNLNRAMTRPSLLELAVRFGTDKAPNCGTYERYVAALRDEPVNFLEIGVGGYDDPNAGGSSIRMWKEYFPKGAIHALDLYDKTPHGGDRVKIYQGSQDDPNVLQAIAAEMGRIDVILDDGSHISAHVIKSFEVLFPLLAPGGIYIVEDIGTSYWPDYGGSTDFACPTTSVSYFKKIVDGIQHPFFHHPFQPGYADANARFVHFYPNIVIIQKV